MFAELIEKVIAERQYPVVGATELESFLTAHTYSVLFFCNDTKRFPESLDVAVILPELEASFNNTFAVAVIARADEVALQKKYGFKTWPALVFCRGDGYLGTISKVQDWDVYQQEITALLAAEVQKPPVQIPVVQ